MQLYYWLKWKLNNLNQDKCYRTLIIYSSDPQPTLIPLAAETPTTTNTPTIINPPIITQADQSSSESSFMGSTAYMVILIIVNVIGIGVIITLIIKTLAKKQV